MHPRGHGHGLFNNGSYIPPLQWFNNNPEMLPANNHQFNNLPFDNNLLQMVPNIVPIGIQRQQANVGQMNYHHLPVLSGAAMSGINISPSNDSSHDSSSSIFAPGTSSDDAVRASYESSTGDKALESKISGALHQLPIPLNSAESVRSKKSSSESLTQLLPELGKTPLAVPPMPSYFPTSMPFYSPTSVSQARPPPPPPPSFLLSSLPPSVKDAAVAPMVIPQCLGTDSPAVVASKTTLETETINVTQKPKISDLDVSVQTLSKSSTSS